MIGKVLRMLMLGVAVVILIGAVAIVLIFASLGRESRSGSAPGLAEGRLARCPESPNCINTEYADDAAHYAAPLRVPAEAAGRVMADAVDVITEMGGTVVSDDGQHVAAEFRSRIFGFVDDFEIRFDRLDLTLHVRSASRVGYGDMGVNARRVERFEARLAEELERG